MFRNRGVSLKRNIQISLSLLIFELIKYEEYNKRTTCTVVRLYSKKESAGIIDPDKVTLVSVETLRKDGIHIIDYQNTRVFLEGLCNLSICLDSSKLSFGIYNLISERNWVVDTTSIADLLKSMKNEIEIEGFRQTMIRDGVALTKFFMWLEKAVPDGIVTE